MSRVRSALAFAPVLRKDFVSTGRRWQTCLWRGVAVAFPGLLTCWLYSLIIGQWDFWGPQSISFAGQSIASVTIFVTYLIVTLGVPAGMIRGIVDERERGTLGLLVVSPLSPGALASGKILASLARTAIATLCVFPILSLSISFGGVEAGDLLLALVHVAAGGILAAAVASFILATRLPGHAVLLVTYGVLLTHLFVPVLMFQMGGPPGAQLNLLGKICVATNPYFGSVEAMLPDSMRGTAGVSWLSGPLVFILAATTLLVAGWAVLRWRLTAGLAGVSPKIGVTRPTGRKVVSFR